MVRWSARLAAAILAGLWPAAPAAAIPVNFGTAYVPDVAHGLAIAIPQWALDRSSVVSWGLVAFGLTDRFALGYDLAYLSLHGGMHSLGNLTLTGLYSFDDPLPGVNVRAGALAGMSAGPLGVPLVGGFGNLEWSPAPRLRHYNAVAAYSPGAWGVPRVAFDTALEARVLPRLGVGFEVLSGFPYWEFGPQARLGVAPSATAYLTDTLMLLGTYRVPLWAAAGVPGPGAPSLGFGLLYLW